MNVPPHKYLCTIPVIEPPPPQNRTASELAKAEEARELARATAAGWQLIRNLDGSCLYFVSGWWSYQFCFGVEVVQYHAIAAQKDGIPIRDPNLQEYVLGRDLNPPPDPDSIPIPSTRRAPQEQRKEQGVGGSIDSSVGALDEVPKNTQIVFKGNQRYLVQHLEDGTICDLTGRPRTIEIQYHCNTVGKSDRIGWIKEVTTCAYLMAIYTPRLCQDVAFLPPKATKAHTITCREILTHDEQVAREERKLLEMESQSPDSVFTRVPKERKGPNVGGITVGARNILRAADHDGQEARLSPPRGFAHGSPHNQQKGPTIVVASGRSKEKGGKVDYLPDEDVERLDLDPEIIENVRKMLRERAGENGWRLEIVEEAGLRELMAIILDDDEEEQYFGMKVEDSVSQQRGDQRQDEKQDGRKESKPDEGEGEGEGDGDKKQQQAADGEIRDDDADREEQFLDVPRDEL